MVNADNEPVARKLHDAVRLHGAGHQAEAERLYKEIVAADPGNADAWHLLGIVAYQRRDFTAAGELIGKAIGLFDCNAAFFSNLGLVLQAQGRPTDAILQYRQALALTPDYADALYNLGNALQQTGEIEEAAACYRRAVALNPGFVEAHNNLGNALLELERPGEAVDAYRQALALQPDLAETHNNLGNALKALHRLDDAVAGYRQALALKPNFADAHNNLGNAFQAQQQLDEAVAQYRKALALRPDFVDAWNNLGTALQERGERTEAEAAFRRALARDPRHFKAHFNLAIALQALGRADEATASYDAALAIDPDHGEARLRRFNLQLHICDWSRITAEAASIKRLVQADTLDAVDPYFMIFVPGISAGDQRRVAEAYARRRFAHADTARPALHARSAPQPATKLRIGYLSADFHAHATAYLMAEIFELHDRSRFQVFAYSLGPDDGSPMRRRLQAAFDEFRDLRAMSDEAAAARIAGDGVDILVDLKGYTSGGRPEILALRPSQIQVSYLGYPATMGAPFIDYLIADHVICPPTAAGDYTEMLACLPHSYQPNDRRRTLASVPARRDFGLPEHGFVFCAFNASYKITPATFDGWMDLLRDVPDSVLWLLPENPQAAANLRREAAARGIADERLIFSAKQPPAEHLARYALADLFLDTLPCSAHTTASDALWAGLPVLTCVGDTFAGRVGASVVRAAGLPELVAGTPDDYARIARRLAAHRDELSALRARLMRDHATCPLFDSVRTTRDLERLYHRMWQRLTSGAAPGPIDLDAETA